MRRISMLAAVIGGVLWLSVTASAVALPRLHYCSDKQALGVHGLSCHDALGVLTAWQTAATQPTRFYWRSRRWACREIGAAVDRQQYITCQAGQLAFDGYWPVNYGQQPLQCSDPQLTDFFDGSGDSIELHEIAFSHTPDVSCDAASRFYRNLYVTDQIPGRDETFTASLSGVEWSCTSSGAPEADAYRTDVTVRCQTEATRQSSLTQQLSLQVTLPELQLCVSPVYGPAYACPPIKGVIDDSDLGAAPSGYQHAGLQTMSYESATGVTKVTVVPQQGAANNYAACVWEADGEVTVSNLQYQRWSCTYSGTGALP